MRPSVEQLEPRHLAAILGFTMDVLPIYPRVGDVVTVAIVARDYDPMLAGIRGVSLDVDWNPAVLQPIGVEWHPKLFPIPRAVNESPGRFENLSAMTRIGSGETIGNLRPEIAATIQFQAIAAGNSTITLDEGRSRIAMQPVMNLRRANIYFETETITVQPRVVGALEADEYFGSAEFAREWA